MSRREHVDARCTGSTTLDIDPAPPLGADASTRHLLGRLEVLEWRVAAAIDAQRRAEGPVDDDTRGFAFDLGQLEGVLAHGPLPPPSVPAEVARHHQAVETTADDAEAAGATIRLRSLSTFGLGQLEVDLLLVALAPEIDRRFGLFYAVLNDDITRRHATVGLALHLAGRHATDAAARAALGPGGALRSGGLLTLEDSDDSTLATRLRVPARVVHHLLGDDTPPATLLGLLDEPVAIAHPAGERLRRAMQAGARVGYVHSRRGWGAEVAVHALSGLDGPPVVVDLARATGATDRRLLARDAGREALLRGAGLVVGPVDDPTDARDHLDLQAFREPGATVVFHGGERWDPRWSPEVPVVVEADELPADVRRDRWTDALRGVPRQPDLDPAAATATLRLTPTQIDRSAAAAALIAAAEDRPVDADDLRQGARAQNAAGLQRLAQRVTPRARWSDLVLPPDIESQLRELATRWRRRDVVLDAWGLGASSGRGRGVSALFAGPSGTGKTLACEVLAGALDLDLYVIELSTVIDKYIGETSKNLGRIFDEADRVNGVLLFDEADALFGKRSAVQDAKDRHANVEVAYLLQRMEAFDGVAVLTTNLAANLDEAFVRRLDAVIDFPTPDRAQRLELWRAKLPTSLPQADDLDLPLLADRFRLSGSEIANVVRSAAYRASAQERTVGMDDLVRATIREHRKIGRHLAGSELAGFEHLTEARGHDDGPAS